MRITLSEAFKLCDIQDEATYYFPPDDPSHTTLLWSTKVRAHLDMKKIKVTKIQPLFERYGPDYLGMCFTVHGVTRKELIRAGGT